MNNRRTLLAAVVALAILGAACSNDADSSGSSSTSTTKAGTATKDTSAAGFNQGYFDGTPADGGAITMGVESNVASLDPAGAIAQVSDFDVALALYDPLITYDDKGEYAPALATSWGNSPDLKTWTVSLRDGVTFSDGTPFDADAVVKHFARLKDPATKCVCATQVALITSVKATDPKTVTFTLKEPNAFFINQLTGPIGYIASPTATAKWGADFGRHPVGTGAFTLASYDPLVLKKNPTYWRKDAQGNQLPHLDQITVKAIPDATIRSQTLDSGGIDLMQTAETGSIIDAIKAKKYTVQKITGSSSTSVTFNNRVAPFKDVRMRRAAAMAVNRDAINNVMYQGARQPSYSQFSVDSPWYDAKAGWLKYDPEAARKLVAQAKADGTPTTFSLMCVTSEESRKLLTLVQQQLKAVGLDAKLEYVDQGAYVNKLLGADHDYVAGCSRNDENVVPDLYEGWHTSGSFNAEGFHDPKADKIMEQIRTTTDQAQWKKLAGQLQVQLAKNVPAFPLLYDLFANVANEKVSGLNRPEPNHLGAITLATLYLKK